MEGVVPVIETARLRLRPISSQDLNYWAPVTADPVVLRFLGAQQMSREETWRRLLATAGCWPLLGHGYWAVERLGEKGRMIGHVGFADFKRDMTPSIEGEPEMGWVFAREAHGQGYATEAVRAGLEWADQRLAGRDIVAIIDPANAASINLAAKAGFQEEAEGRYREAPILLFRRESPANIATR
jgi:RimJ/RimL family protein N-acetyltransferase